MNGTRASLACWDYDRTRALADGVARAEGIDLTYLSLPPGETFFRMIRNREFEVAEMSLSSYAISLELPDPPFVAIPVFPSRAFRHNAVYVHADGPVRAPADLAGARVGIPEYQVTAGVWLRGIFAERYGVGVESVAYRTGGLHQPGRVEKVPVALPPEIDCAPIPADRTLDEMLVSGEIDALYSPRTPRSFLAGDPAVRRLFADPAAEEREYFAATGIFPIMHTVVLRRDFYEANRWAAVSLYQAFAEAKRLTEERLAQAAAPATMLPWQYADAEEARALMGVDYWPYGVEPNRACLETFLGYSRAQGLIATDRDVADLFAPETVELVAI